ncbi:MAG: NAD-dependent epimerase/dehydratase family protein [Candidatus Omnitrophota bacterium]|nr:NAD-dependent epimerase/dehydratase family protein [Candidatus Omnitrophota bacterium]
MNDLKNKRILITGGAGFVGSFIADQLLDEGTKEIVILDNLIRGSENNIRNILSSKKINFVKGDIRDAGLLDKLFSGADYCLHMAALRITHCATEPQEAFSVMYEGTFKVLEACVNNKINKVVLASSASVYGQSDNFPIREDHHPYNNVTLYGAAKMADELMLRSFYHMYGLKFAALRYFNIYGPRMDIYGKYTEVLIRWYNLIKEGRQPLIYGDGKQTMDFIFVEDVARASILALEADADAEVFNIASGIETSLEELCYLLLEVMHSGLKPKYVSISEERNKVEVKRRWADISKSRRMLGFEARVSLKEGLQKLVIWLKEQEKNTHPKP